jgi:hypothetical protein
MSWCPFEFSYFGFCATVFLGVVAVGYLACVLPDLFPPRDGKPQ